MRGEGGGGRGERGEGGRTIEQENHTALNFCGLHPLTFRKKMSCDCQETKKQPILQILYGILTLLAAPPLTILLCTQCLWLYASKPPRSVVMLLRSKCSRSAFWSLRYASWLGGEGGGCFGTCREYIPNMPGFGHMHRITLVTKHVYATGTMLTAPHMETHTLSIWIVHTGCGNCTYTTSNI